MAILITGVAGFIGCNLARIFITQGKTVFGVDNFCRGSLKNIAALTNHATFSFEEMDIANLAEYRKAFANFHAHEPITEVWHLAANSDIPAGVNDANVDLKDTFMTTFNTLEVMKAFGVDTLAFASSSAIYGDLGNQHLVEEIGPLLPISNYGAMKLASEATISAAAESHLKQAFIFRFPNVIGVPATHGVMLDFVRKLKVNPKKLDVLGDGTQQKSYLHVSELIDAMLYVRNKSQDKVSVFNIGSDDEGVTVKFIAEETVRVASPSASIHFGDGNRGWVGDVPRFFYSIDKLKKLGWQPKLNSAQAVRQAMLEIRSQEATNT